MSSTLLLTDGDITYDGAGRLMFCSGELKLDQDIALALTTPYSVENEFGNEAINNLFSGVSMDATQLHTHISNAITRLMRRQDRLVITDPAERITAIKRLSVIPLNGQPGVFGFVLDIQTGAGRTLSRASALKFNHLAPPAGLLESLGKV